MSLMSDSLAVATVTLELGRPRPLSRTDAMCFTSSHAKKTGFVSWRTVCAIHLLKALILVSVAAALPLMT